MKFNVIITYFFTNISNTIAKFFNKLILTHILKTIEIDTEDLLIIIILKIRNYFSNKYIYVPHIYYLYLLY